MSHLFSVLIVWLILAVVVGTCWYRYSNVKLDLRRLGYKEREPDPHPLPTEPPVIPLDFGEWSEPQKDWWLEQMRQAGWEPDGRETMKKIDPA